MNNLGTVEVQFNATVIDQALDKKLDEHLVPKLRMVTEKQLCKMYNMSPNDIAPLLFDARVRVHERRKGELGKKRWFYPEVQHALDEVINENM